MKVLFYKNALVDLALGRSMEDMVAKVYKTSNFTDFSNSKPVFINPDHVIYITPFDGGTMIFLTHGNKIRVMSDYADVEKWLAPHFGHHYDDES